MSTAARQIGGQLRTTHRRCGGIKNEDTSKPVGTKTSMVHINMTILIVAMICPSKRAAGAAAAASDDAGEGGVGLRVIA